MAHPGDSHWFLVPRPAPAAALRLFCIPYAGGGASMFQRWAARLPAGVELCAVQLPGRETRLDEEPFDRFEPLLDALELALLPYLDRRFALFGHSMGAILAFELARALERRGAAPAHVIASGRAAPQLADRRAPIHGLPPAQFLAEVSALGGTPPELLAHGEVRRALLPTLQADFAAIERWRYAARPPLTAPLTAVGGAADPRIGRAELDAWRAQTTGEFALQLFAGGHFFLRESEAELVALLAARCSIATSAATRPATRPPDPGVP